jgi:triacylglycerol lipase
MKQLIVIGLLCLGSIGLVASNPAARAAAPEDVQTLGDRTPIVFAHGLGISGEAYELLGGLRKFFGQRNRPFLIAMTPVAGSIEERAEILKREIARLVPSGKLHLVAHSMGGLDARLALQDPALAQRVLSLTTLSTPHHGSPVADYVVRHLDELETNAVVKKWVEKLFGGSLDAVRELTTTYMDGQFNPQVADVPGVQYFSMGFYIPAPVELHSIIPWLWAVHAVISEAGFSRNDGMVSVESARWGTSLGVLAGDHYSETSPIPLIGGASYLRVFSTVLTNIEKRVEKSAVSSEGE